MSTKRSRPEFCTVEKKASWERSTPTIDPGHTSSSPHHGYPRRAHRPRGWFWRQVPPRRPPRDARHAPRRSPARGARVTRAHGCVRGELQADAALRRERHAAGEARPHPTPDRSSSREDAGGCARQGRDGEGDSERGERGAPAVGEFGVAEDDEDPEGGGRVGEARGRHQHAGVGSGCGYVRAGRSYRGVPWKIQGESARPDETSQKSPIPPNTDAPSRSR